MCRMDFVVFFPNVKTLTLINQGIGEIEVRVSIFTQLWYRVWIKRCN